MANIYSFSPFGYEGSLVSVEVDLRRGIPAVDVVGLADGAVKETRERVRSAVINSGFEFPSERVLISLSPADLKKEGAGFDLPVALGILNAEEHSGFINENVLVMGELELSGRVRAVKGIHAACSTAFDSGIQYAIVPKANFEEACSVQGLKVAGVESLEEAVSALKDVTCFGKAFDIQEESAQSVSFSDEEGEDIDGLELPKRLIRAIEIAVAGKHNLLITGRPGCGKTMTVQRLIPLLTPNLTVDESQSVTRIWSLAGLMKPTEPLVRKTPFRLPHQTASIEGICGGGPNCRPGEISLAHNGVLFLDEAAEFRSSVLQMLRVPLESHTITLSRAGRSTTYPANFQLIMATNPCPCGNYGSKEKICLCSAKSVEQYWKKFSAPLIDRIGIILNMDEEDEKCRVDVDELRNHIRTAFEIQRKNSDYNNNLSSWDLSEKAKLDDEAMNILDSWVIKHDVGTRRESNILKVCLTIANMDGREIISKDDVLEAISYSKTFGLATA
ncbi:MAG: YifB family Mg chelatase-like AAA ATPase [Spirochaetia bacterium]|nr:YifB family Mg chelatase-like AAA ATPase [Spirochaetia bacterium]